MPYYFKQPDTEQDIEAKILILESEISALQICLSRTGNDLLKNHLNYDSIVIDQKRKTLGETRSAIDRKKNQVANYKAKINLLKRKI